MVRGMNRTLLLFASLLLTTFAGAPVAWAQPTPPPSPMPQPAQAPSVAPNAQPAQKAQPAPKQELIDFAEITEIELRVLRRMKEYTLGDHGSVFHGTGVDFVGLRDWQAGDRMSSIDWPQSTLTNFTPMVMREYEQPGTAPIVVVADRSPSTRCGVTGTPIAVGVARAMATIGLSAVYFQDMFGLIAFDSGFAFATSR